MYETNFFQSPHWAKKMECWGNKHNVKHNILKKRKSDYIGAVVINIIILYLINKVPGWNFKFIKDGFTAVLWVMNINFVLQIAGNLCLVIYSERWFRNLVNLLLHTIGFVMFISLYIMYPFSFANAGVAWLDKIIRILLFISIIIAGLHSITYAFKLIFGKRQDELPGC